MGSKDTQDDLYYLKKYLKNKSSSIQKGITDSMKKDISKLSKLSK